jgi:hypothetical protein
MENPLIHRMHIKEIFILDDINKAWTDAGDCQMRNKGSDEYLCLFTSSD